MRRFACLSALTVLCLAPALAPAAEGDYVLKAGKVYRVDGGGERPLEDAAPQRAEEGEIAVPIPAAGRGGKAPAAGLGRA